jgi:hypothetical protein
MSREYRRIVATDDSNGKSEVLIDGPVTSELASFMPQMWETDAGSHNHTDRLDRAELRSPWAAVHRTRTTDYIVLLSGKVRLVLDKEDRDREPFDVVVQRGTNHAWVNTGSEDALLMTVMIDDHSATKK